MKIRMNWLLFALAFIICFAGTASAAITTNMEINQVVQDGSGVAVYANLMDDQGNSTGERFSQDKFTGQIDGVDVPADGAINFNSTGEGVYYVACVDISKSLNNEDMGNIRAALEKFISYMNDSDYMSIYTFGVDVKPLVLESNDKDALLAAVSTLQCSDMYTQLYGVVNEALSLARVRSADMPVRSAVIVMTDGTDDPTAGKGDVYTFDNTLNVVKESGTPVYTIAVEKNNQQLDNLESFAQASGGALMKVRSGGISDELNRLRMQVRNATLVHLPLVNEDGSGNIVEHSIGLKLNTGDGEITAVNPYTIDIDWHAVPAAHVEETEQPDPIPAEEPEEIVEEAIPETEPEAIEDTEAATVTVPPAENAEKETEKKNSILSSLGDYIWFVYAGIFIVLALVILLVVLLSGKRRKKQAQKIDGWGEGPAFNSVWDSESAYDFVESAAAIQAVSRMEEASQMGYGAPSTGAAQGHTPATERIGQQAQPGYVPPVQPVQQSHTPATERIGQQAQLGYAPPVQPAQQGHTPATERIGQQGYVPPVQPGFTPATQRLTPQNGPYGANIGLSASSGTVRLAPQENGIKILIEESRRVSGVYNTRYVYLEKTLIFGRNFDCDYIVQDDATSGEHFKFSREVDGIYITDLKSSNGTMVNGRNIHEACALRSEDVIKVGNTTLRVRFEL